MKKQLFLTTLAVTLLAICGAAWALDQSDHPAVPQEIPAILAALDSATITPLDDAKIAEIRGQATPRYVLVRIVGLNTADFGPGVVWTWNPLGYRYGYYGGPNWSNIGETPVDAMDGYFALHDSGTIKDIELIGALELLRSQNSYWGDIYLSEPTGAPVKVYVSGLSLIGGKIFFGWKAMPYSEYSRREAVYGMKALLLGKSILKIK